MFANLRLLSLLLLLIVHIVSARYFEPTFQKRFYQWDNGSPTVEPKDVLREAVMEKEALEFIERSKDASRLQKLRVFPG